MHPSLPAVRLTPEVVTRVQQRLLGLFGGVQAPLLRRKPPKKLRALAKNTRRHPKGDTDE